MGWFEDTVSWCAGGPWLFAALLFPGSKYPMDGKVGNYSGAAMAREAGPLFSAGKGFGLRTWFASTLAAPECSLITLTQTELVAHAATFNTSSPGIEQGLSRIGDEITRWRRGDVGISISFTPMKLQATQRLMVGDKQLPSKVRIEFTNRALNQRSIMNCFTNLNDADRSQAWTDRSISGGSWTNDFTCFAEWWAKNPDASISS